MGLIVQHDDIINGLKQLDIYNGDELIIYATLKNHQPLYTRMNYLDLNNYVITGVWLAISENYVHILPVDQLGKLKKEVITISREDTSLSIKKNLLLYTLYLEDIEKNIVEFRVSSNIVGNKKHHADFVKLLKVING